MEGVCEKQLWGGRARVIEGMGYIYIYIYRSKERGMEGYCLLICCPTVSCIVMHLGVA